MTLPNLLSKIEQKAKAADPKGEQWEAHFRRGGECEIRVYRNGEHEKTICYADCHFHNDKEIFTYIAAANPQTMLRLIAVVRMAIEQRDEHIKAHWRAPAVHITVANDALEDLLADGGAE